MKIVRLNLYTSLLRELKDFYTTVLELKLVAETNHSFSIKTRDSELVFTKYAGDGSPHYHVAFGIPTNKIMEAFQFYKDRVDLLWIDEYQSYIADFSSWHAKSFYFKDPAGNILELIARQDLHDETMENFLPQQVTNISEIGIVFPASTFDKDVEALLERYGLPYFDKQPPLPQFRAIGSDEGLFIAVPSERQWFPTKDTLSGIFPLTVDFDLNGRHCQLVSGL